MSEDLFRKALEDASGVAVSLDEPMSSHTTFRIGGPADYFVCPSSSKSIERVVSLCRENDRALFIIGCGSNLLVADDGLRGVVMKVGSGFSEVMIGEDGNVSAEAGATNAKIARMAQKSGLGGFEFAAGIPGSIGGAAIMNAGAYDGELRDVAIGVTCLDPLGNVVDLIPSQVGWSYRHSMIGESGHIVLSVKLRLYEKDPEEIKARIDELARRRNEKQPLDMPSGGSTFKRPEGRYAGKLIQDAGMQGHSVGGAQVSIKHAGFVVNTGGATASDVRRVIQDVQESVFRQFGVILEPEIRMWGFH